MPASSFADDMRKLIGDPSLPEGKVSFIVGVERRRLDHVSKANLCVRSAYFNTMFRSNLNCPDEVEVHETSYEAFETVIQYLLTDQVTVDTSTQHAFDTMDLARRYQLKRLELLCQQCLVADFSAENVVPLIEASHRLNHHSLVGMCRSYIQENSGAILAANGVQRLESLAVAKGLLLDSMLKVASYEVAQE